MVVLSPRLAGMLAILSLATVALALPASEHSIRDHGLNREFSMRSKEVSVPLYQLQSLRPNLFLAYSSSLLKGR